MPPARNLGWRTTVFRTGAYAPFLRPRPPSSPPARGPPTPTRPHLADVDAPWRLYSAVVLKQLTIPASDLVTTGDELGGGCEGVVFAGRLRGYPVGVKRLRVFLDPVLYQLDSTAFKKQLQLLEREVGRGRCMRVVCA